MHYDVRDVVCTFPALTGTKRNDFLGFFISELVKLVCASCAFDPLDASSGENSSTYARSN